MITFKSLSKEIDFTVLMQNNEPTKESSALVWFSVLTTLNLGVAFCVAEYFQHQTMASVLSFSASDAPGPLQTNLYTAKSPLGVHYFGDLFQILQMSKLETPYINIDGKLISQYPPLGHWLFYPVNLIDPNLIVIATTAFIIVTLIWALVRLSHTFILEGRTLFVMLAFLSGPVISVIDRGNLTSLVFVGMVACLFTRVSKFSKIIIQVMSTSLKFFPVLFYFEIARQNSRRFSLKSFLVHLLELFAVSLVGFFLIGGGFRANVQGFTSAFLSQTKTSLDGRIYGVSMSAFIDNIGMLLNLEIKSWISFYATMMVLLLCVVAILVQYVGRVSKFANTEERLIVIAATICLVPTVVGTYQLIFLLLPLAIYIERDRSRRKISLNALLLILLVLPTRYEIEKGVFLNSVATAPILLVLLVNTLMMQGNRVRLANAS